MNFVATDITGLFVIDLEPFEDHRGHFSRIFCQKEFQEAGLVSEFVQVNHSTTFRKGTIRGLHYQIPPFSEVKVIRCVRGSVIDIVVDIRKSSPTFLRYFAVELSETNNRMIYIPEGFAHGFQTLQDHSSLIYQHSNFYQPNSERGIRYDEPRLGISWPLEVTDISEKDHRQGVLPLDFIGIET